MAQRSLKGTRVLNIRGDSIVLWYNCLINRILALWVTLFGKGRLVSSDFKLITRIGI